MCRIRIIQRQIVSRFNTSSYLRYLLPNQASSSDRVTLISFPDNVGARLGIFICQSLLSNPNGLRIGLDPWALTRFGMFIYQSFLTLTLTLVIGPQRAPTAPQVLPEYCID
jgi:hypothetical protein